MKVLSLNVWGGEKFEALKAFLIEQAEDTDIFCFQEVFSSKEDVPDFRSHLFEDFKQMFEDFDGYFYPSLDRYHDKPLEFGIALFVRKSLKIDEIGDHFVSLERGVGTVLQDDGHYAIPRNIAYVKFDYEGKSYLVTTLHGLWTPTKADTDSRIEQSERTKAFMDKFEGEKILCGDFNLRPDTKSLAILEKDMTNLIKEYKITTTRSNHYHGDEKFADYMLVSPGVEIKNFEVLQDPVSDHLPLVLEF